MVVNCVPANHREAVMSTTAMPTPIKILEEPPVGCSAFDVALCPVEMSSILGLGGSSKGDVYGCCGAAWG